jgi:NADH-quinone oxidoreductase subunit F
MKIKSMSDYNRLSGLCTRALDNQKIKVLVSADTGGVAVGALEIYHQLKELIEEQGLLADLDLSRQKTGIGIKKSGCFGCFEGGPLVKILPHDYLYLEVKKEDCAEIVQTTLIEGKPIERLMFKRDGVLCAAQDEIPYYKKQLKLVLENCGKIDPESIEEYIVRGGYRGLAKCIYEMAPEQICREVLDSNLRGRGGGGFPTGRKWTQVLAQKSEIKYVVCNGDEGDPGAFMDRCIMEGDPHLVIEGMAIAGYATRSAEGYIYVRAEYPLAVQRLKIAIEQAGRYGFLGEDIMGSGFNFNIKIVRGAGAFVCGEGSAMTASMEGRRGNPRVKPPRTVEQGFRTKPTLLNNVETFANIPLIIKQGSAWFKAIGPEKSPGTKVFALAGNVRDTGLIEVPMGTTLGEVVFEIGGGIPAGKKFKAVQIGGPSGGCLTGEHLDLPLDFDSLAGVGAMIGSGGLVVMDEDTCMVEIARYFQEFCYRESCGQCAPCRLGTKQMLEILTRMTQGEGRLSDLDLLEELSEGVAQGSLCGLGETAPNPVLTTLRYFREEYEAHIHKRRCPARSCKALITYRINPEKCKSCSKCVQSCPVGAISGARKEIHVIDGVSCIKCGACLIACPDAFGAVECY